MSVEGKKIKADEWYWEQNRLINSNKGRKVAIKAEKRFKEV